MNKNFFDDLRNAFNKQIMMNVYSFFLFESDKETPEEIYEERMANISTHKSGLIQFLNKYLSKEELFQFLYTYTSRDKWKK